MAFVVQKDCKHIVSKSLVTSIIKYLDDAINELGILWSNESHRNTYSDIVEDYMVDLLSENKIDQFNIICDSRNNCLSQISQGHYCFELRFKQHNCLIETRIMYRISDDGNDTGKDVDPGF